MKKVIGLTKQDFKNILGKYVIGEYVSHKHIQKAFENTVYFLQTTKGKYVLKIFEQTKVKAVQDQTKIQEYLASKNNPVPKIIKDKQGKDIQYFEKNPSRYKSLLMENA
jgi:homoserine kinase type II